MASTSRDEAISGRGSGRSTADVFGAAVAAETKGEAPPPPAFDRFVRASSGPAGPKPALADALAAQREAVAARKVEDERLGEAEIVEADKHFLKTFEEDERRAREAARKGESDDILEFRKARAETVFEIGKEDSDAGGANHTLGVDDIGQGGLKRRACVGSGAASAVVVVKKKRRHEKAVPKEPEKPENPVPCKAVPKTAPESGVASIVAGYGSASSSSSSSVPCGDA